MSGTLSIGNIMKNYEKKGSKSGLLKTFGPSLGFTVKTVLGTCDPRRSRLPFRTKNPENAGTSCIYVETKKCLLLRWRYKQELLALLCDIALLLQR